MKIYHNNIEILNIHVDDTSVRYRSIMQDNNHTLNFSTVEPVSVYVGSYCEFEGGMYLNKKGLIMSMFKKEKANGMTVIRNPFFPFSGYKAINLFGIMFAKPNAKIDELTINHESIHSKQYREVTLSLAIPVLLLSYSVNWWWILLIPFTFYLWYVVEWIIRVIIGQKDAYKNISFEKDAYIWQEKPKERKRYSFLKYIKWR